MASLFPDRIPDIVEQFKYLRIESHQKKRTSCFTVSLTYATHLETYWEVWILKQFSIVLFLLPETIQSEISFLVQPFSAPLGDKLIKNFLEFNAVPIQIKVSHFIHNPVFSTVSIT